MYSVSVLTPRGRRQQVKVTPNTTILQILEEVCAKHGFEAKDYDLRHHNKILDASSIFRFTSLPNNAQLEMTEAMIQRRESPVTLGLQFESGERLTGVFSPSDTIWHVIVNLKPEEEKSVNLVVIYMRQEIYGTENLKKTTLRSLGLTSGRAMLRVLHKSPEELRIQANVSSVLPPRMSVAEKPEENVKERQSNSPEVIKKETSVAKTRTPSPETFKPNSSPTSTRSDSKSSGKYKTAFNLKGNIFENLLRDEKTKKSLMENRKSGSEPKGESQSRKLSHEEEASVRSKPESEIKTEKNLQKSENEPAEEPKVILLGERNAVAFSLNSIKPMIFEEEPDDFYELTIHDAQLLLKEAKQLCADFEDAPLMTSAQREFEKDKRILSLLHQYKKTVLRIKFPDRTVLQGTFSPLETIAAVEKFVAEYLDSPKLHFYLYTTPPKVILKSDTRLIENGCVPSSVLYFGLPPEVSPPTQYLKSNVLEKLSTPSAAALQAYQMRGMNKRVEKDEAKDSEGEVEKRKWRNNSSNSEAGPSGSQQWENKPRDHESSPHLKVPKWFRANK